MKNKNIWINRQTHLKSLNISKELKNKFKDAYENKIINTTEDEYKLLYEGSWIIDE